MNVLRKYNVYVPFAVTPSVTPIHNTKKMSRVKFTDRWIRGLNLPEADRLDYVDAICPGLYLRISRSGVKSFSVVVRQNRRLRRITIGRFPRWNVAEARAEARSMLRSIEAGHEPKPVIEISEPAVTYSGLVDAYFERHLKLNARSATNIKRNLLHKRLEHLFKLPAVQIPKKDIASAIDSIARAGTPHAAVNILRNIKMMYNWAVDVDLVDTNPSERIRTPVKTTERDRVLNNAEIVALWHATFQLPAPFGQMYRMFMLTGQRRSEVATMRWVDITNDVWVIPREIVKKDRSHAVPLTRLASETLSQLPCFRTDGFVFTTTGGVKSGSNFNKTKRELDRISGVTAWTIHDLRRTVRSKLAELRIPREVARKILNHEDGKVDRIYNRHEYLAEKREALTRWGDHLLSMIGTPL